MTFIDFVLHDGLQCGKVNGTVRPDYVYNVNGDLWLDDSRYKPFKYHWQAILISEVRNEFEFAIVDALRFSSPHTVAMYGGLLPHETFLPARSA